MTCSGLVSVKNQGQVIQREINVNPQKRKSLPPSNPGLSVKA